MKTKRFIELLNLCVDQELTPAEARELEHELQANPSRQRTYLQYCRMQKACLQLFEAERACAPATPRLARALADAGRKLDKPRRAERPHFASWRNIFALGGVAAAAACVAVFVAFRDPSPAVTAPDAATLAAAPAATEFVAESPPAASIALVDAATPAPVAPITFATLPRLTHFRLPSVTGVSSGDNAPAAPALDDAMFAWAREIQMRPIRKVSAEDAIMALRRLEKPQVGASFLRIPAVDAADEPTEMTVIEFKR